MSWKRLEYALRLHGISAHEAHETRSEHLMNLTNPSAVKAIESLREARNAILHGTSGVNGHEAYNYGATAEGVVKLLINNAALHHSAPKSSP